MALLAPLMTDDVRPCDDCGTSIAATKLGRPRLRCDDCRASRAAGRVVRNLMPPKVVECLASTVDFNPRDRRRRQDGHSQAAAMRQAIKAGRQEDCLTEILHADSYKPQQDQALTTNGTNRPAVSALVINAYSCRNVGDAAIMLGTAALLREARVRITVSTRHFQDDRAFYARKGVDVTGPILPLAAIRSTPSSVERRLAALPGIAKLLLLGALAAAHVPTAVRRVVAKRFFPVLRGLGTADFVVMAGGGYLYSRPSRSLSLAVLHAVAQVHLCRWAAIPVISMPQSVGPVTGRFDRWLVQSLRPLPLVLREVRSSAGLGLPAVRAPDVALMLRPPARRSIRYDAIIVVMDWTWARVAPSAAKLTCYIEKIARAADLLAGVGLTVALAGHSRMPEEDQDDFAVAHRVAKAAVTQLPVLLLNDVEEALSAYSATRFVIGTRLHSVLLALNCGTPALALEYQMKSSGCLADIGWSHVRDVESFSSEDVLLWVTGALEAEAELGEQASECCRIARQRLRSAYAVGDRSARSKPDRGPFADA
jgi:colanic acid/amylovoran biosynthesis protein